MNGEEMRTDDPHAIELRDAQDPETSAGRLQQLEVSTYSDVRLEVAANYTFRLARHLLALHLAHGASVTVKMTNQYRCWDGLAIRVKLGRGKGAWTWDLRMYDPDFDGLLSRIDDLAPEWLNDDDEDSLGYFLQRHKGLLQVLLRSRPASVRR